MALTATTRIANANDTLPQTPRGSGCVPALPPNHPDLTHKTAHRRCIARTHLCRTNRKLLPRTSQMKDQTSPTSFAANLMTRLLSSAQR